MMITHSLKWDDDDPIFDFKLLGIKSPLEKDSELAFFLNKNFTFHLERINDLEIKKDNNVLTFSAYYNIKHDFEQKIWMISNLSHPKIIKSNNLFDQQMLQYTLVPELNKYNYFIKSNIDFDYEFYVNLPKYKEISYIEEINIQNRKVLENLILFI